MLILLPPSETKADGGTPEPLRLDALAHPELLPQRSRALAALSELALDGEASRRILKLGPKQAGELERNRVLESAPTMPALRRYTGVLYDAVSAAPARATASAGSEASAGSMMSETGLDEAFAAETVRIHSALFGLLAPDDAIPAYRLSAATALPGLPLKRHWAQPVSAVLDAQPGLVLDLRSQGYRALGPLPAGPERYLVQVLSEDVDGRVRALNHFNKQGKGELAGALLRAGIDHPDAGSLMRWAAGAGFRIEMGRPGELNLYVAQPGTAR